MLTVCHQNHNGYTRRKVVAESTHMATNVDGTHWLENINETSVKFRQHSGPPVSDGIFLD
jgi:hypothetical protein